MKGGAQYIINNGKSPKWCFKDYYYSFNIKIIAINSYFICKE